MAACSLTQTTFDMHGTGKVRRVPVVRGLCRGSTAAGAAQGAAMAVVMMPSAMRVRYQLIACPLSI
jgi:hypothetical protein